MAEAPRSSFLSGYDEEFVTEVVDDYQCLICCLPLREPVLTRCGHRYCKECLEEYLRREKGHGIPLNCPTDRIQLDRYLDVFPDKATERKILSLAIKCPSDGCEWSGELREKETHLAECDWKFVFCTNKNCPRKVPRKDLKRHVKQICQWRIIKCKHCSESYAKCEMEDHLKQCRRLPVACPKKCGQSIPRETITNHIETDCPLTLIACPFQHMGCKTETHRRQLESHIDSNIKSHLNLACLKLKDVEVTLSKTKEELAATKKLVDTRTFIWKVDNFGKILEQAKTGEKEYIESDPFYTATTESHGYKLKVRIDPNGFGPGKNTHLSVFIFVMKGEYDAILPWPFRKKVNFTLIDQQEDPAKRVNVTAELFNRDSEFSHCFVRPVEEQNTGWGCPRFVSHEKLNSRIRYRYLVDDALFLQVDIGPPRPASKQD